MPTVKRLSNIELLRIIAMFLVLIVHADFFTLGPPEHEDMLSNPTGTYSRLFWEAISIVCVDVFVLISGWFGIRPKVKGFCNFIFQCLFFLVGIYIVCLLAGIAEFNVKGIAGCLLLLNWNWFIKAYLGLYLLAPLLNAFLERSSEVQVRYFLIAFFTFQTIYGWTGAAPFFEQGYSTMSFIGLYMLARYANIYQPRYLIGWTKKWYLYGYLGIVLFLTIVSGICIQSNIGIWHILYSYISPLVIIAAFCLLIYFSKLNFSSSFTNKIAASSFAVFLLHTNPNLCRQYFSPFVQSIYDKMGGVTCLLSITLFLILVFVAAVLIDQIRIFLWEKIWKKFNTSS